MYDKFTAKVRLNDKMQTAQNETFLKKIDEVVIKSTISDIEIQKNAGKIFEINQKINDL